MTPEQQRFIDYATVEAAANGFAFELREPRDDREGASLTIKGKSGYETLGISPDGWVGSVRMSPSYDRALSKFIKKLLAAGKKMRPELEKKPKPPKPPARRCSSARRAALRTMRSFDRSSTESTLEPQRLRSSPTHDHAWPRGLGTRCRRKIARPSSARSLRSTIETAQHSVRCCDEESACSAGSRDRRGTVTRAALADDADAVSYRKGARDVAPAAEPGAQRL